MSGICFAEKFLEPQMPGMLFLFVRCLHKAHFVAAGIKIILSEHIKRRNRNNTLKREWKTEDMDFYTKRRRTKSCR